MKDIYDLDYLRKLSRSIDRLLDLAELEEEDSLEIEDARNRVRYQVKGICIDLNINRDFLKDFQLK
jgi:hypothetical protein